MPAAPYVMYLQIAAICIHNTTAWSGLYFASLLVLGNLFMVNLLVAILISQFQSAGLGHRADSKDTHGTGLLDTKSPASVLHKLPPHTAVHAAPATISGRTVEAGGSLRSAIKRKSSSAEIPAGASSPVDAAASAGGVSAGAAPLTDSEQASNREAKGKSKSKRGSGSRSDGADASGAGSDEAGAHTTAPAATTADTPRKRGQSKPHKPRSSSRHGSLNGSDDLEDKQPADSKGTAANIVNTSASGAVGGDAAAGAHSVTVDDSDDSDHVSYSSDSRFSDSGSSSGSNSGDHSDSDSSSSSGSSDDDHAYTAGAGAGAGAAPTEDDSRHSDHAGTASPRAPQAARPLSSPLRSGVHGAGISGSGSHSSLTSPASPGVTAVKRTVTFGETAAIIASPQTHHHHHQQQQELVPVEPALRGLQANLMLVLPKRRRTRVATDKRALYIFPPSPLRKRVSEFMTTQTCTVIILLTVLWNTIGLALDSPTRSQSDYSTALNRFLFVTDVVTTVIYSIEAALKIFAWGLVMHRRSYLRSPWNVVDFAVVIVSIIDLSLPSSNIHFVKAFRALRALRPLRLIRRVRGLKAVVEAFIRSMPRILLVLGLVGLVLVFYGIMGVALFKGLFAQCEMKEYLPGQREQNGFMVLPLDKTACEANPTLYAWRNPRLGSFDNLASAMLLLFEIATPSLWPVFMYRAIDVSHRDSAPSLNEHPESALYFLSFIIITNFFVLNLFIAVVVGTFQRIKDRISGMGLLTERQRLWIETKKLFLFAHRKRQAQPPPASAAAWQHRLFSLVQSARFELAVSAVIVMSVVVMALPYWDANHRYEEAVRVLNWLFSLLFVVEVIVRVVALNPLQFLWDTWNRVDAVLATVYLAIFLVQVASGIIAFDAKILRAVRLFRVFRVVDQFKPLHRLVQALVIAVPSLLNVGALIVLFFFVFGVVGVSLFSDTPYGQYLSVHSNFDNLGIAMLTLFRVTTG